MDRRQFVATLGIGLAAPGLAHAQGRKPARIGWVGGWYSHPVANPHFDGFREGMRKLGYVEGQNLTIDARWMKGTAPEEAAALTAELLPAKLDLLVAQGHAVIGARAAAGAMPIVFIYSGDPVVAGIVASLARPGSNLTGVTLLAADLGGKRLELLKEAAPRVSHVGAFVNPLHPGEEEEFQVLQASAQRMGVTVRQFQVRSAAEVAAALEAMSRDRIDGIVAFSNALITSQRNTIGEFAARHRIPTISAWEDFAVDGNLMTYGPSFQHAGQQVATYVDKVLRGAKPADLPVEQPTKLQLVINLRTAKMLALAVPPSLLLRADRVIE